MKRVKPVTPNAPQAQTLALLQQLAKHDDSSVTLEESSDRKITRLPHAHGDHMHVGDFVVSAKDGSGFNNPSVWIALARKGLIRDGYPAEIVITEAGLNHATGLESKFMQHSDH